MSIRSSTSVSQTARIDLCGKFGVSKSVLIDSKHLFKISKFKWYYRFNAARNEVRILAQIPDSKTGKLIWKDMKRFIWEIEGLSNLTRNHFIRHYNKDMFDNRVANLYIISRTGARHSSKIPKNNTSGYKGVHWAKKEKVWKSYITICSSNGEHKVKHLGCFDSKYVAALAYDRALAELDYIEEEDKVYNLR